MAYREIEGDELTNFFKFTEHGQQLEGVFQGTRANVPGDFGPQTLHDVETADGRFSVRGNPDLNSKLAKAKKGQAIRISYVSDLQMGGFDREGKPKNPMKVFRVEVDDGAAAKSAAASAKAPF